VARMETRTTPMFRVHDAQGRPDRHPRSRPASTSSPKSAAPPGSAAIASMSRPFPIRHGRKVYPASCTFGLMAMNSIATSAPISKCSTIWCRATAIRRKNIAISMTNISPYGYDRGILSPDHRHGLVHHLLPRRDETSRRTGRPQGDPPGRADDRRGEKDDISGVGKRRPRKTSARTFRRRSACITCKRRRHYGVFNGSRFRQESRRASAPSTPSRAEQRSKSRASAPRSAINLAPRRRIAAGATCVQGRIIVDCSIATPSLRLQRKS